MYRTLKLLALPLALALTALLFAARSHAEEAKVAKVGEAAPAFELVGTDGKTHKLSETAGKITVIYFHSVQCPWAKAYQPILNEVAAKYATGKDGAKDVVFVGINSNATEDMKEVKGAVKEYNIQHLILKDHGNKVADAYGAQTTPHIYIVDAEGKLVYIGGLEKSPGSPGNVGKSSEQYLDPALANIVTGKAPSQAETVATGCTIKRAKKAA